jgi:hypothetical protein
MIDSRLLRKLLTLSGALCAAAAVICALLGHLSFAGGLMLGYVLGALPAVTWAWVMGRALATRRGRVWAVVISVAKLVFYPAALFALVTRPVLSAVAVFAGITAVVAVLAIGSLLGAPRSVKEAV